MKLSYFLLLSILLVNFSIFCQEEKLETNYTTYFQNTREIPYLHLNKTYFLKGEEIWFQAFVVEQNSNKLHKTTSNLYVSIFDESGKMKDQHLVHIKNGIGKGNILLDSTFTQKNYYLKASTNWMKNFKEDNSFIQKVKIVSDSKKKKTKILNEDKFFDFQLFPEGGHLVADTNNNIGILVKNSKNEGVKITNGIIKNSDNEAIGEFTTNNFGLGKSSLYFIEDDIYTFEAELPNGIILKKTTPYVNPKGIILSSVEKNDFFELIINTNEETLEIITNNKYKIFIHNSRNYKSYHFNFNSNNLTYKLKLNKNELLKGINIITLFNNKNIPIAEKIIFNESEDLYSKISIKNSKLENDSLSLEIINNSKDNIFYSASILPVNTKAYNPKNNIKSTILLKPYIKGYIQNPEYYFDKTKKDRLKNLNLLFLTQGWSKFNWDNIFSATPKTNYSFENGIQITAKLNSKLKKNQSVLLYSKDNNLVRDIKNTNNPLILKNTFLKKNSIIDFALRSNGNYFKITPVLSYSKTSIIDRLDLNKLEKSKNLELEISNFKSLSKGREILDEVVLKANKLKYNNNAYGANTMLTSFKMEEIMITSGELVADFLEFKRFNVEKQNGTISFIGRRGINPSNSNRIDSVSNGGDANTRQRRSVRIYLDDLEITDALWFLDSMYLDTVKEILFGREPSGIAEVIYIYTLTPQEYSTKVAEFSKVKVPIGFINSKVYYNPEYPSYLDETYKNFGAVFWISNNNISNNSKVNIKVPANLQTGFKIFIEGISSTGKLISQKNTIEIEKLE